MAVNEVIYNGKTLINLKNDTVTPETLAEGVTAHDASGKVITGIMPTTAVLYTAQTLTDAQKAQARENIGIGEEYRAQLIQDILDAIGCPVFGIVDENNNIILTGALPDATYSVKYEMEDGSKVDIGDLVLDTNVYYSIVNTLTNCTNNNSTSQVVEGESYSAIVTAKEGYELKSVTVTMGGSPVTVSGGTINIASVTGNIVITAVAEEIKVSYTNYAKNFEVGRLRSGGVVDSSTTAATTCSDYIPFTQGTVVRVKGFGALTDYNCALYDSNGTSQSVSKANAATTMITYTYDSASGIVTLTSLHASIATIRVSGILTGSTADVIITVNEEIV